MDVSQFDWLTGAFEPFEERLPDSFFAGFDRPRAELVPVFLDDQERHGEPEERVDPQTGYVEDRR